jgi:hypothetical protein
MRKSVRNCSLVQNFFSEINKDLALDSFKSELDAALPANDTPYRKRLLVIVTDEEWDGKELAKSR